jgi:hypothetical protein
VDAFPDALNQCLPSDHGQWLAGETC